ncbi:hypothetical protein E2562_036731 [Oryza meyeriana var. granulata]|uniref:Uncharacterized protein n=1 Tax=Oryza meyeriana var. granulata TaxID=110450 RepID=A0A6G1E829_9ORYZ|nr:hypothetical protein E2562_036731 [Oryza meyeriana var. granulata]
MAVVRERKGGSSAPSEKKRSHERVRRETASKRSLAEVRRDVRWYTFEEHLARKGEEGKALATAARSGERTRTLRDNYE